MSFTPYLSFNGDCAEALDGYAQVLGGGVTDMYRFAEMPPMEGMPPLSDADGQKVMHARLVVRGQERMASDTLPGFCADGQAYQWPQGFSLAIGAESVAESERIFNALAEGGQVTMPFAPTFFSQGFGQLTDRFGIPWMIDVGHPEAG